MTPSCGLLVLLTLACLHTAHAALLEKVRVENLDAPLAVAVPRPRLSWVTGAAQESYRLTVTDAATGQPVFDTGLVPSSSTRMVVYNGTAPLLPASDYVLAVTVQLTGVGLVAGSTPFSTAPPATLTQPGNWLGGYDTLRASFTLSDSPVTRARLHVTGVGCYHAWLNGVRLSAELSPGWAHAPNMRTPYDTYDIGRSVVQGGENVLGIRLGSCKYGYLGSYCAGSAVECNAAWALLMVGQEGGNTTVVTSNSSEAGAVWQATNGPVLFQHLYHGETYDARLEQAGWSSPGFTPPPASPPWSTPLPMAKGDLGPLTPSTYAPVVRASSMAAVSMTGPLADGSYVFDYGVNMAGVCSLTLPTPGTSGAVLRWVAAEQRNEDGSVRNTYIPCAFAGISDCANQTVTYTLSGLGQEGGSYTPHFTYAGFRFVQLWGWAGAVGAGAPPPMPDTLLCHFTHSALEQAGSVSFNSSSARGAILNSLQAAVVATHLSNLVSLPTDCPQREKRGWTGDAQLTAQSAVTNFDMQAFYENWHGTMLDQQRAGCGGAGGWANVSKPPNWQCSDPPIQNLTAQDYLGSIGDVVPQGYRGMGLWPGDASWEVAAVVIPHTLLSTYGASALLHVSSNYDGPVAMLRWFNKMATAEVSSGGLLPWSYLGDWIPIAPTSGLFVADWHYLLAAHLAAELAGATGHSADAATFLALATLVSDALPGRWWNASAGVAGGGGGAWDAGSQTAQLLGIALQAGGPSYTAPATAQLLADIAARDTHLSVGAAGARYLLQVLDSVGSAPLSLALATQTSYPAWAYEVTGNSSWPGTLWESWDWDPGVTQQENSANHIFKAGGLGDWLYTGALGLAFAHRLGTPSAPPPCPAQAALHAPHDVRERTGLSCEEVGVVARVVARRRAAVLAGQGRQEPRAVWGLPSLAQEVQAALAALPAGARSAGVQAALTPRLSLTLPSSIAESLGSASGWRATPHGNASWAWAVGPPPVEAAPGGTASRLTFTAQVPCGVLTRMEVPLRLLQEEDRASGVLTLRVSSPPPGMEQRILTVPGVRAGEGAAAAWLDARAHAGQVQQGGATEEVLVLEPPCGLLTYPS